MSGSNTFPERPGQPDNNGPRVIPTHGGYRSLRSFQVAELVYDGTVIFCDRFIDKRSRTHDQMVQAARSGRQNIAEGSMASATSKKTELKLTNVAKASLEELLLDYEDFLRQRGLRCWDKNSPEALDVRNRFRSDQSDKSDRSDSYGIATLSPEAAANTLICLVNQATYLLAFARVPLRHAAGVNGKATSAKPNGRRRVGVPAPLRASAEFRKDAPWQATRCYTQAATGEIGAGFFTQRRLHGAALQRTPGGATDREELKTPVSETELPEKGTQTSMTEGKNNHPLPSSAIILYRTEDGRNRIEVRLENDTVWLTQQLMAELFQTTKQNIGQHLKNIYAEGELRQNSVVKKSFTTAADGKHSTRTDPLRPYSSHSSFACGIIGIRSLLLRIFHHGWTGVNTDKKCFENNKEFLARFRYP
jgi:four helix bundle protein